MYDFQDLKVSEGSVGLGHVYVSVLTYQVLTDYLLIKSGRLNLVGYHKIDKLQMTFPTLLLIGWVFHFQLIIDITQGLVLSCLAL